jgi:hypothetical protein
MNCWGPARLASVSTERAPFKFGDTLVILGFLVAARSLQVIDSNNVALSSRG